MCHTFILRIAFIKTNMHGFVIFLISFRSYCSVEAISKGFFVKIYIYILKMDVCVCVCVCVLHSYCIAFIKTSMHDFKIFLISFHSYCIVEAIRKGFLGKIYIHPKNGATGLFSRYCMCHNSFPAP